MTTGVRLGADDLQKAVTVFRGALRTHQEAINRLNVYPVPDGDTGTNMALTLESVVSALESSDGSTEAVAKAVSHGSLMGARGNSGVILSQILRGLVGVWSERVAETPEGVDGAGLAAALTAAAEAAYGAVMRPVEGTILTVVRETAEAAEEAVSGGADLVGVLEAARTGGQASLERTPELLPVLADAGVVDAGASGFLLFIDSLLNVLDGQPLPEPDVSAGPGLDVAALHAAAHGHGDEHNVGDLRYEVMYFLEAPDDTIPAFKNVWAGIGDSIVVVGGDGIWNCHIHTDDIGASIEAALDCGRPRDIRVTDLMEQVEEERWVREAPEPEAPAALDPVTTAVVAISTGDGIRRIFHSLGVQGIVAGGQSMNPATADILAAVEAAPADSVIILPNNKNIIPVAEQVDALTDKAVTVVPTRSIAEGFAALLEYDPGSGIDTNTDEMAAACSRVVAAEVTRAVRASSCDVGPIAEGDYIGIAREGIRSVEQDLTSATTRLLAELVGDDHEIVTLIEGEGYTAGDTRRIQQWLADNHPDVMCEVHHGGQPLYPYFIGIE